MADTYYVDHTNGSDAYDGKSTTYSAPDHGPWKTLAKVSAHDFSAGDIIRFRNGCVWDDGDQLVLTHPNHSGTTGNVVTLTNYALEGDGTTSPTFVGKTVYLGAVWTQVDPGGDHPKIWKHDVAPGLTAPDVFLHYNDNTTNDHWSIREYPDPVSDAIICDLIYAHVTSGTATSLWVLYDNHVYLYHDSTSQGPAANDVYYQQHVIVLNGVSYVTIENIIIESGARNVWIRGASGTASNITLKNIVSRYGAMGFHCMGDSGAPLSDVTFDSCHALSTYASHGFKVGPDVGTEYYNTRITFTSCTSHHNKANGFSIGLATDVTCESCDSHSNSGAFYANESSNGFMVSSTKACMLDKCKSSNNALFGVCVEKKGAGFDKPEDITIQNCLIVNNGYGVIISHLADYKYCRLYYNTVANNGSTQAYAGGLVLGTAADVEGDLYVRNNIFANARNANEYRKVVWRYGTSTGNETFSNNLYYNSSTVSPGLACNGDQNTFVLTTDGLNSYRSFISQGEPDTLLWLPYFADWVVDGASNDFTLTASSPAIHAAADLGITEDINGNARSSPYDIGCYRYV